MREGNEEKKRKVEEEAYKEKMKKGRNGKEAIRKERTE
jgi:hypothetical protein